MKVVMMKSIVALLCASAFFSCKKNVQEPPKSMNAKLMNAKMPTKDGFERGPKVFESDLELETVYKMLEDDFKKSANFTNLTEKVSLDAADALAKKIEKEGYQTRKIFLKSDKPIQTFVRIYGPDRSNENTWRPGHRSATLTTHCAVVVYIIKRGEREEETDVIPVVLDPLLAFEPRDVREWGTLVTQNHNWGHDPAIHHMYIGANERNANWNNAMK